MVWPTLGSRTAKEQEQSPVIHAAHTMQVILLWVRESARVKCPGVNCREEGGNVTQCCDSSQRVLREQTLTHYQVATFTERAVACSVR